MLRDDFKTNIYRSFFKYLNINKIFTSTFFQREPEKAPISTNEIDVELTYCNGCQWRYLEIVSTSIGPRQNALSQREGGGSYLLSALSNYWSPDGYVLKVKQEKNISKQNKLK